MEESSCELIDNIISKKEHFREGQSCNHALFGKKNYSLQNVDFYFSNNVFWGKISNTCTQIVKIVNIPKLPSNPSLTCRQLPHFFFFQETYVLSG